MIVFIPSEGMFYVAPKRSRQGGLGEEKVAGGGKKKKGDRGASLTYVWWAAINRRPLIGPAGLMKQSCRPLNRDQLGEQEESRTGWHLHYHIWQKWILVSSAGYKIHNEYCWVLFWGGPLLRTTIKIWIRGRSVDYFTVCCHLGFVQFGNRENSQKWLTFFFFGGGC